MRRCSSPAAATIRLGGPEQQRGRRWDRHQAAFRREPPLRPTPTGERVDTFWGQCYYPHPEETAQAGTSMLKETAFSAFRRRLKVPL